MLLETNRLIIEYFNTNDISDWAEIESDADVRRFVDGKVLSLKEAGEYVELNIRQYQTHEYGRYAVRLKENRKLIGMCGFLNEPYGIDFGYRYSKDSWGKGLGFEAGKEVLEYGFSKLGLASNLSTVSTNNDLPLDAEPKTVTIVPSFSNSSHSSSCFNLCGEVVTFHSIYVILLSAFASFLSSLILCNFLT